MASRVVRLPVLGCGPRRRYSVAHVDELIHTGRVGRTVSAEVTWGEAYLGVAGPFAVVLPPHMVFGPPGCVAQYFV